MWAAGVGFDLTTNIGLEHASSCKYAMDEFIRITNSVPKALEALHDCARALVSMQQIRLGASNTKETMAEFVNEQVYTGSEACRTIWRQNRPVNFVIHSGHFLGFGVGTGAPATTGQ